MQFTILHAFILALELYFLIYFLERIANRYVFLELLSLIAISQWLLAPMIAERIGFKMDVPYHEYYSYALPGTLLYVFGLTLPLWNHKKLDLRISDIISKLKLKYRDKGVLAVSLFIIGLPCWVFQNHVPPALSFLFYLMGQFMMMSVCLMIFTESRFKWLLILGGFSVILATSFFNGMVGIAIFWAFIVFMMYSTAYPIKLPTIIKAAGLIIGVWIMVVLQVAKTEYRSQTWASFNYEGTSNINRESTQDPILFYQLITEHLFRPRELLRNRNAIPFVMRLNQGYLVSHGMDYVPDRRSFGNGEVTLMNTAIAFIPRMLWKDKPIVGQAEYFKKYTGIQLGRSTSATLGALGDAYVDFGKGGIIFLGILGATISLLFSSWMKLSSNTPSLFLWFVGIYYVSLSVSEVSVAGYINSIFKFIIFIIIMRFVLKKMLHIPL